MTAADDNPCLGCGAKCCSFRESRVAYLALEDGERYDSLFLGLPQDTVERLALSDGSPVSFRWFVWDPRGHPDAGEDAARQVVFVCDHYEGGLCSVYEDRPGMCRNFECAVLEGETDPDEWEEEKGWDADPFEEFETEEVTGRVNEILGRRLA